MKYDLLKLLMIISKNTLYTLIVLCLCQSLLLARDATGQSIHKVFISFDIDDAQVAEVLEGIADKTGFKFAYGDDVKAIEKPMTLHYRKASVAEILQAINQHTGIEFHQINETISAKVNLAFAAYLDSRTKSSQSPPPLAQIIRGKVTDESGTPLPGASVLVKGIAVGAVTDKDGNYVLEAPDEATTLVFSFIGYITEEVEIAGRSVIDLSMLPDIQSLQEVEVVSTGYYEVERRFNPGNIAKVDAKTIEQQPVSNPLEALQGRLTGVDIQQRSGVPGSNFNIRIRGQNSLRDGQDGTVPGNDPLYLINGIPYPVQSLSFNGGVLNSGGINPLNFINPNDIESIEILKDADATAIYGTRGANGVVRITTKQAKKGELQVTYNGSIGFGTLENKLDVLNTEQYLEMRREALRNDGVEPSATDFDINGTWNEDRTVDWQEEFLGGSTNFSNHQLSFSGGSNNTSFLVGLNYLKQTLIFSDDFFDEKFSTNLNINHISSDRKFEMNFQGNFLVNNNLLFFNNLAATAVTLAPNAPELFNENGDLNWENGTFTNPMAAMLRESETRSLNWTGNVNLSYEVIEGLRIKSVIGFSEVRSDETYIIPIASANPFQDDVTGISQFGASSVSTWSLEPQIEYQKALDKHDLTTLVGFTLQETIRDREQLIAEGFTSDALLKNPLAGGASRITNLDFSEYRFNSIYARINYMFDEKYIVNLTGRRDGSSRFGPGERFANFGAIGVAWLFGEEDFITENLSFLSFGKLRGSYGLTGSDAIGNYEFLELFEPTEIGYAGLNGLIPATLPNAIFAWEETIKEEVGLELGFFDDRIRLNTSYFQNSSSNQLIGQPLPAITGFGTIQSNFPAEVENTGWEFDLNLVNISKGDFRWSTNFNISILRNELVSFDNIENTTFANTYTVGEPLSAVNLLQYTGVDPETGIATYRDVNGDDRIVFQDDALPLADLAPNFFGGLGNTVSYKGLTLDFFFRFVKQDGRSLNSVFSVPGQAANQPAEVLNRWQNPGDVTETPRFTQSGIASTAYNNISGSTQGVEDASFIRLQNVSLSYQVPTDLISKYRLQSLSLYLQGQNLLTLTGYRGWDPETQFLSLPPLRVLTAGLSLTF